MARSRQRFVADGEGDMNDIVLTKAEYDRLFDNCTPEPTSGCWIWLSSLRDGYARTWIRDNVGRGLHRLFYIYHKGAVPVNHVIDHKCQVRCCLNPDHMEAVSWRTNALRGAGPTAANAQRTHCVHGHEFVGKNIIWRERAGQMVRDCRECSRRHTRELKRKRREAAKLARGQEAGNKGVTGL